MSLEIRKLNQLRRTCTSHWKDESDMPRPIVTMSKDPEGCDDMMNAFRTIASEMGLRHVHLCLVDNLTAKDRASSLSPILTAFLKTIAPGSMKK